MTAPPLDLKPIMDYAINDARKTVLEGGEHLRTFYAGTDANELNIICAPPEGEREELALIEWLRLRFALWGVTQYAMVAEAWTSSDLRYSRGAGSMPMNDPNRREAITAIAVRRVRGESGKMLDIQSMARCEITRNPTRVGDIEWMTGTLTGSFVELLPPAELPPIPFHVRAAALAALDRGGFGYRKAKL